MAMAQCLDSSDSSGDDFELLVARLHLSAKRHACRGTPASKPQSCQDEPSVTSTRGNEATKSSNASQFALPVSLRKGLNREIPKTSERGCGNSCMSSQDYKTPNRSIQQKLQFSSTEQGVSSKRKQRSAKLRAIIFSNSSDEDINDSDTNDQQTKAYIMPPIPSEDVTAPHAIFLTALSCDEACNCTHPDARVFIADFINWREVLASRLFTIFNETVFDSQLPHDMVIEWSSKLTTTAGKCYSRFQPCDSNNRTASIELSSKIVDSPSRLRDTLLHELCHAATWIISKVHEAHGFHWAYWSRRANAIYPEIPKTATCHNFIVTPKRTLQCQSCKYRIQIDPRSSKGTALYCPQCSDRIYRCKKKDLKLDKIQF